ncbi:hypothetical protein [Nodularia chucula]|uniref:hypothetical protein n=1 Tax=Nodularia chucula TaxID=3093667 RepID=UPI0039C5C645
MVVEIDPFPVTALQDRYAIGKQAVYNRLEALDIKPFKQGNKSYVHATDVELLDQLHQHIKDGGKMDDFKSPRSVDTMDTPTGQVDISFSPLDRVDTSSLTTGQSETAASELIALVEAIAPLAEGIARHLKPSDPLQHLKALEEAAKAGWILSSTEVEDLIGCKPKLKEGEQQFVRGSFGFVKSGRVGNQSGWRVVRLD